MGRSKKTWVYPKTSCETREYPGTTSLGPSMPLEIGTCAHCHKENRPLKYARRTMCASYACQRAAHLQVSACKADAGDDAPADKAAPTFCYEIIEVYGHRDCNPLALKGKRKRNELPEDEHEPSYLIFGTFAEDDEGDEGFKDTRWVDLDDLLNLGEEKLEPLVKYEKGLAKRMKQKRADMLQAREEEEEEESEE